MAQANMKQISDFFRTGNPQRDSLAGFSAEWKQLTDAEKTFFKDEVGAALGL